MDGENNGSKPYEQMDDLGVNTPYFWFNTQMVTHTMIFRPLKLLDGRNPTGMVLKHGKSWDRLPISTQVCHNHLKQA